MVLIMSKIKWALTYSSYLQYIFKGLMNIRFREKGDNCLKSVCQFSDLFPRHKGTYWPTSNFD
jgi:hypothetical protein